MLSRYSLIKTSKHPGWIAEHNIDTPPHGFQRFSRFDNLPEELNLMSHAIYEKMVEDMDPVLFMEGTVQDIYRSVLHRP